MDTADDVVSTTHHTLICEPWNRDGEETGGVHLVQLDDPSSPVLMLRNTDEVIVVVTALLGATDQAQALGKMAAGLMDALGEAQR